MSGVQPITAQELKNKIDQGEHMILIDALHPLSFDQEHIPTARNIPYENISSAKESILDQDAHIIVYCASKQCTASAIAAKKLVSLGFTHVSDFEDGLVGWKQAGYPLVGTNHQ